MPPYIHRVAFKQLFFLIPACLCMSLTQVHAQTGASVHLVAAPKGSLVPDVCMDKNGVVHMVYALNDNAYYVRSTNNGKTFSPQVKVNNTGIITSTMGERGPKISVGGDGVIHVVWADKWFSGVQVFARYTRSLDGGKTFENPKPVSATYGIDGLNMAADGLGHVAVFWHTMLPAQSPVPEGTWLHKTVSSDNGASFGSDENISISNHNGLACSMCMTRARFGADGKIYLVFRSAEDTIRDFYVIKGNVTENKFTAVRVNNDNWVIPTCPMVGPELTVAPDGRQLCAFMTRNKVYWSISDGAVGSFSLHVPTPPSETNEIYPSAIANSTGDVLFLWQVGPMSVSSTAIVKWAMYSINGTYTGQHGVVGSSFSGTKSTSFVGTDNDFYIVTNADIPASVQQDPLPGTLNVYPNPSQDVITVQYNSTIGHEHSWTLMTVLGREVLKSQNGFDRSSNQETIDIRGLDRGVYFLRAREGEKISYMRIVKR